MKRLILLIAVMVIAGASSLSMAQIPASATPTRLTVTDPKPITVKIHYTWRQTFDGKLYDCAGTSLGTFIGPDLILTHNHFSPQLGHLAEELFTFQDEQGRTAQWRPRDLQLIALNAGTMLIRLPTRTFSDQALVADVTVLQRLAVGAWVQLHYRDSASGSIVESNFQILQTKDGLLKLADPDHRIETGDSGGGVFFENRLIGNTWSIDVDSSDRALGRINVAVLPLEVGSSIQQ